METEKKTPETETEPAKKYNIQNLQPCRDTETARERGRLGAIKSAETKRKKKDLREQLKALLEIELSKKKARDIIPEFIDETDDTSLGNLIGLKMIQEALEGNVKSAEFVRDTAGYKPTTEINLEADIITEKDKQLLEALTKSEK